jgi:thioredoxin reductase
VSKDEDGFHLQTTDGIFHSKVVIAATGSFTRPVIPDFPGMHEFRGDVLHSSQYHSAEQFAGRRVGVFGEGNSGAQILSEVSKVADTVWVTLGKPQFLPDHVDGRFLFDAASQMYEAKKQGKAYTPPSLGQIVMVEPVKDAFVRGVFNHPRGPISHLGKDSLVWPGGEEENVDAIILCTGFSPAVEFLQPLGVIRADGRIATAETRSIEVPGLWLVGYGNWTGFASSTLIGVGRSARATVDQVTRYVSEVNSETANQITWNHQ